VFLGALLSGVIGGRLSSRRVKEARREPFDPRAAAAFAGKLDPFSQR
jgi:hypothetical protein